MRSTLSHSAVYSATTPCVCVCVCEHLAHGVPQVTTGLGEQGVIESSFGKSGKQKVTFSNGLAPAAARSPAHNTVTLLCKRYLFDEAGRKKLRQ
jgi:hypothetical protein